MKINLILLAAGNSKRFNGNKLLYEINNKPMYRHIIDKVININFNKIILVTQYKEIIEQLSKGKIGLSKNQSNKIEIVLNNESYLGISNSIKIGINKDKTADAYMFMVCDQPFIKIQTIEALIDRFNKSNKGIACIGYKEDTFNPVIFSNKYLKELLSLSGDVGGKRILKNNLDDVEVMKILDEKEVIDLDTKEIINILESV